jgi:ABC-type transporter Mla subunit MlaD
MGNAPSTLDSWRAANAAEAEAARAAASPENPPVATDESTELLLDEAIVEVRPSDGAYDAAVPARRRTDFAIGGILGLAGTAWLGIWLLGIIDAGSAGATSAASIANWIALASGPLALLGILYILIRRTSTREAKRFADTALSMRLESQRLEAAIAQITAALDSRRADLSSHTSALLDEGNRAAERLAQISMDMRDETSLLARHSDQLGQAAATARNDITTLMSDLPQAKALTEETAGFAREIGESARDHAEELSNQLALIIARSHEADELIGAASSRLATQIGRIETRAERTTRVIDEVGSALGRSMDSTLDQTGAAVDHIRQAMDDQRAAMATMIEHARASIDEAGSAAALSITRRMEELQRQADAFAAKLAEQDGSSRKFVDSLERALGEIERRFEALGATGTEQTADLAEMIVALSEHVENVGVALTNSMGGAHNLTDRANALRIAFDNIIQNVERELPATMTRMESEAARGDSAIRAIAAQAEQLVSTVERATDRLGSADLLIDRQREAIAGLGDQATRRMAGIAAEGDALLDRQRELSDNFAEEASARLEALRDHSAELGRLIAESEANMRSLAELSGGRLIEALLKVRETAGEAARGAREALESIIPDASEQLARSGAEAIERAFGNQITQRIQLISDTAEAAVGAANRASEKLLTNMLTIAETSANMEMRISHVEKKHELDDQDMFARRVSLLVESLNSAAIDVAKLLSRDVSDKAWAAYLQGDHGAFTRRAVQLLDEGEAQHVGAYYDGNPEFRDHVNKYIQDFEEMLRRILNSRDGGPLGVTMLSSDMGKLYVALAQAIDRLRV